MFTNHQAYLDTYVIPWGIEILLALLILVVGMFVAKLIVHLTRKLLRKGRLDDILINFVGSILNAVLVLFVLIAALDQLGVNTTSPVALLGAAGIAVGLALQDSLKNFSARDTRRLDLVFGISYGDDLRRAKEIVHEVLAAETRILPDPAPVVAGGELADSSVNLVVRPWVRNGDYWDVKFALTEAMQLAFDA